MDKKLIINPENEYNALRQDILKKTEYAFQLYNIKLTLMAAFLGFGIKDNRIAMLLPPVELIILLLWRGNQFEIYRTSHFISKKYEGEGFFLSWETYHSNSSMHPYKYLFSLGNIGLFLMSPIIATVVGCLGYEDNYIQNFLFVTDIVSVISIIIVFLFTSRKRIAKTFPDVNKFSSTETSPEKV